MNDWKAGPFGTGALWAFGGIIVIATIYEINPRVGLGLFVLAVMGLLLTYQQRFGLSYERRV